MTTQVPDLQPDAVIDFWFRDPNTRTLKAAEALSRQWFSGGASLDDAIRAQFYTAIEKALAGGFKDWECESEARLALIVILDQFTRQAFRGTVRAFVGDPRAIRLAKSGWDKGYFDTLPAMMQAASLMPLQHSERLEDQQLSVARFTELADQFPEVPVLAGFVRSAQTHHDIVARFGRFPHRNLVLGRASTTSEEMYLANANRFGQ